LKGYEEGGGSGEIEFNVYSLHDIFVTYLFDTACMFAHPKVYIHLLLSFFFLSSASHLHINSGILIFFYLSPDLVDLCIRIFEEQPSVETANIFITAQKRLA
jgi:hypothetical protein